MVRHGTTISPFEMSALQPTRYQRDKAAAAPVVDKKTSAIAWVVEIDRNNVLAMGKSKRRRLETRLQFDSDMLQVCCTLNMSEGEVEELERGKHGCICLSFRQLRGNQKPIDCHFRQCLTVRDVAIAIVAAIVRRQLPILPVVRGELSRADKSQR